MGRAAHAATCPPNPPAIHKHSTPQPSPSFSAQDWLLGVMAGGSTGWMRATAGLVPIEMAGVENVNLTNLVVGHFAYIEEMTTILDMLHLG